MLSRKGVPVQQSQLDMGDILCRRRGTHERQDAVGEYLLWWCELSDGMQISLRSTRIAWHSPVSYCFDYFRGSIMLGLELECSS
jgi:hypothetical protein